jgi:hypothetical protein
MESYEVTAIFSLFSHNKANRCPPNSRAIQFPKNDPRLEFTVNPFDPRIHFGIVCGSPALRVFQSQNVNESLQFATESFCNENLHIDLNKKMVTSNELVVIIGNAIETVFLVQR